MERWVEAIVISMQTARESKMSLTGACKNISMLVSQFDMDKARLEQKIKKDLSKRLNLELEDWDGDIDEILQLCSQVSDELIETFDACLAIKP
jgi:UV DNA damage repair endonuclease